MCVVVVEVSSGGGGGGGGAAMMMEVVHTRADNYPLVLQAALPQGLARWRGNT
ncbi:hypothetical protein K440DRAFT_631750 [Wilcoxina mikolae CBS 423.85]|nr:hypothetical protein K440DRAFT_631750 [Wilcoxina mikolae CBS 423.85]